MTSIADLYVGAQASFVDLFQSLGDDDLAKPVPCTPSWTVRDLLSHVAGVTDDTFSVALIPTTLAETTLGFREPGDTVNLEVDVVAKYVERLTRVTAAG